MKERTKIIESWHELVEFVETINPNLETICLTGWINEIYREKTYIRKLVFTTKDINILKTKVNGNEHTRLVKRPIKENTGK